VNVFAQRRAALLGLLQGPALLLAGRPRARNYPANPYPYRAESHFLYFTGASLPRAALWLDAGASTLFVDLPAPDDELWHGPQPGADALREATGVDEVRPLEALPSVVAQALGRGLSTLPANDPVDRHWQNQHLGRDWPLAGTAAITRDSDVALAEAVIALRLKHDGAALAMMEHALEGTAAAHLRGMAVTRPGRHEAEIRAAMEHELLARGLSPAYGSIVTVHGEVLHNVHYDHVATAGDLLLADVGGEAHGWASDITRTWPVSGRFSATQRALYEIVLAAQHDAIAAVRPHARYRDVHLRACLTIAQGLVDEGILVGTPETLVERGAHALLFPHGIGHLLGLDVHDMEDLGDRAGYAPGRTRSPQFGLGYLRLDRDLEPGMVVTIEPGIYQVPALLQSPELAGPFLADGTLRLERLAAFSDVRGIRIEDDVLCTDTGHRVLSRAIPKLPAEVEAQVGSQP